MPLDSELILCAQLEERVVQLAGVRIKFADYSFFVEFKDVNKTALHFHQTGHVNIKSTGTIIDQALFTDPHIFDGLLPIATYKIRNWEEFEDLPIDTNPDLVLLIPKEITASITRISISSFTQNLIAPVPIYQVGIPGVIWMNFIPLHNEASPESFNLISSQPCSLSKGNHVSEQMDQGTRFIEISKKLRAMAEASSEPSLHPLENVTHPLMVRLPNSEGVWEIIFEVPMRIVPNMTLIFIDPKYLAIDCGTTKEAFNRVSRKFKVRNTVSGAFELNELPPFELILDAEL